MQNNKRSYVGSYRPSAGAQRPRSGGQKSSGRPISHSAVQTTRRTAVPAVRGQARRPVGTSSPRRHDSTVLDRVLDWFRVRDHRYTAAKLCLIALLVAFIGSIFSSGGTKNVDFSVISGEISENAQVTAMQSRSANALQKQFGVDPAEYANWLYYSMDSVMDVDELLIVHAPDADALARVQEKVTAHVESQKDRFRDYGTNQYDLLSDAVILQRGDYLFYGVSESVDDWQALFLSCVS